MPTIAKSWRRALAIAPLAAAALALPSSASAGVALSTSGWEWSDPAPQGYTLSDVQFYGTTGYAVGAGGTALRTIDGGNTWTGLFTGTSLAVNAVDVIDPNTVALAIGDASDCSILLSKDAGATFSLVRIADVQTNCTATAFTSMDFVSGDVGFVMKTGGAVQKTIDAGLDFSAASTVDGGSALDFIDGNTGFAVGRNVVYKTTDGAQTWKPIDTTGGALSHIQVIDPQHIVAWGKDRLIVSTDGGTTWVDGTLSGEPARVTWSDPLHLAFVSGAKLLQSDDGGLTTRQVTIGNNDVRAASFVSPTRIVAVGNGGVTYTSDDAGLTFARQSSVPVGSSISSIVESSGGTASGPIGLGTGKLGRVIDGQWQIRTPISSARVISADFSSVNSGYALFPSLLLHTVDNGASWRRVEPGTPSPPLQVVTPDDNTTLLFGAFGIYRATGSGTFAKIDTKITKAYKVSFAQGLGQRVIAASYKNKVAPLLSGDGGETWAKIALPKGITRVDDLVLQPGKGLLLVSAGRLFRTANDAGKSWVEITSLGDGIPSDGAGIHAASATEFFAGDGGDWPFPVVYHSADAGKTWQPQAVGAADTEVSSLAATGPKSAYAYSFGQDANTTGIFSTTTGGSRGTPTTLSLAATKPKLKASGGKIQIAGALTGGHGTETVHVALRKVGAGTWITANVQVGENGGAFSASLKAKKGKYVVVAQWAGDSGRAGFGTPAQAVTVS